MKLCQYATPDGGPGYNCSKFKFNCSPGVCAHCASNDGVDFPPKSTGLGDVVARLANPIARIIDSALGTDLVNCGGCAHRKDALNNMVPDIKRPLK